MGFKEIILGFLLMASVALGMAYKYNLRAERRAIHAEMRAEEQKLKDDLYASKGLAEASLPDFLAVAQHIEGPEATLKIRIDVNGGSEHIWVQDFTPTKFIGKRPIEFEGVFSNAPEAIPGMEIGDPVAFSRFVIEDWGLVMNGQGYGFYSVRAFLPTLDGAEAAQLQAFLAPNPLPEDWAAAEAAFAPAEPRIPPRDRFMAHLGNPPESWEAAMVQVYWMEIETKANGQTVGYAQVAWVGDITRLDDGRFQGTRVNDSLFGQSNPDPEPITFTEREIKDWGFVENGMGYGFTLLRKGEGRQTPVQKQKLAAFFAPDPLPEGW